MSYVYICVVDNNFTNSCKIIISSKIISTALIVLKVHKFEANKLLDNILKYLIDNNYNKKGYLYDDTFFYECVDIIIPYLTMTKSQFIVVDLNNKWCCCY